MLPLLAKPLIFALYSEKRLSEAMYARIEASYWQVDFKGEGILFDGTDYYEEEFGKTLYRHVFSFAGLVEPLRLPELKTIASQIEAEFAQNGKRAVNLDFGYLDTDKLVLGSFKPGRNKQYLGMGVYGDILLEYAKGQFTALPWAFADFKDDRYNRDLLVIREKYKGNLKK